MNARCPLIVVCVALAVAIWSPGVALASPELVSSTDLVENSGKWDGVEILFVGEAIGEIMVRGDNAWIHVNDDAYAAASIEDGSKPAGYNSGMAVYLPAGEGRQIGRFGSFSAQGDIVSVVGVFRAASPEHGGEMLIEGRSLEIVEPGRPLEDPMSAWKLPVIAALALLAALAASNLRRLRNSI